MKDVQATGEVFSPQKTTSSTSKHEISSLFSIFVGHFFSSGSGSCWPKSMRVRIHNTENTGIWWKRLSAKTHLWLAPAAAPSPWPAGGPGRTRGGPASGRRTALSATPRPSPAQSSTWPMAARIYCWMLNQRGQQGCRSGSLFSGIFIRIRIRVKSWIRISI